MSTHATQVPRLALAEAIERLQSPCAPEDFSPLTGEPLLIVDLGRPGRTPDPEALAHFRAALLRLPCPSVAITGRAPANVGAAFDVLVDGEEQLAPVARAVSRAPLAAMALAQLLRQTGSLDVDQGLVAESLVYATLQGGPEFRAWREAHPPRAARAEPPRPAVRALRSGDQLHLTLDRPERRNAFSSRMRDALVEALELALLDPALREIRIDGAGPAFCSGGDLDEFGSFPDPATAHAVRSTRSPARLLAACADRVRVHVHGACVGAGIELPAFAAHVVAAEDSYFELPELAMGLVPGAGGSVSLPRRIGRQRTAWLALSGRRIDAATALDWGLVDEIE